MLVAAWVIYVYGLRLYMYIYVSACVHVFLYVCA